jgi:multisubunit Na+/H+ antiporter MnhB subunit/CheY-like chemotaxis protein/anti-sigma regulatory factor (Ser/Thr protein kinase)
MFKPRVQARHIDYRLQMDARPVWVEGDSHRLMQLLVNLLGNAVKFAAKGSVVLTVKSAAKEHLIFEVEDTGMGIEPYVLSQLFAPFKQADATMARRFGGTGLGLAICKQIVDLMQGEIHLSSEVGTGTCFTFTIPFRLGTNQGKSLQVQLQPHTHQLQILCAEDFLPNQLIIQGLLEEMGHRAEFVENGQKALEALPLRSFDLILMDGRMPEMDGATAIRLIRAEGEGDFYIPNPNIRIIMLTVLATAGLALAGSGAAFLGRDLLGDVKADTTMIEGVLVALIIAGALAATLVGSRLAAIVSVGLVGYCIALLFVVFGAPDVAMTQFAVETLSVIILLLVVFRMPRFNGKSSRPARLLDACLAAGVGVLMTGLVLAAQSNLAVQPISHFFAERSLTEGYGRNVVNVILVDFRALDTMGEITVLGIAAVGIWTLLRIRPTRSTDLSASVTAAGRGPAAAGHASGIAAAGDGKDGVPS